MLRRLGQAFHTAAQRYVTSLGLWLSAAPFMIFGLLFTELSEGWTLGSALLTVGAGTAGYLALGFVLWIARLTILAPRRRGQVGWPAVPGTLAIGGLARAVTLDLLLVGPGVSDVGIAVRGANSVGLVVFSFSLAAYSAELWRQYRDRRHELLYSIAIGGRTSEQKEIAHSEFRSLVDAGLDGDITKAREQTMAALASIRETVKAGGADAAGLVTMLQKTDRNWRALSHKTWLKGQPSIPRLTLGEMLRTFSSARPISLLIISAGPAFMALRVIDDLGANKALVFTGLWWAGALVLASATNILGERARRAGAILLVIGFALLQLWALLVGTLFLEDLYLQTQMSFVGLVSSASAVLLGLPVALERSGRAVLEQLEKRLSSTTLEGLRSQSEMFVLAQRVGTYLHSEVRADFLRLSLQLREALEDGDRESAVAVVAQLEARVAEVDLSAPHYSEIDNLREFLNNWAGVIRLSHNLDSQEVPEGHEAVVSAIVMEAVSNAVRHTDATEVNVRLTPGPTHLRIEVENDGDASSAESPGGLGSGALDLVAPHSWSRETGPDGIHRLKVLLPLA